MEGHQTHRMRAEIMIKVIILHFIDPYKCFLFAFTATKLKHSIDIPLFRGDVKITHSRVKKTKVRRTIQRDLLCS